MKMVTFAATLAQPTSCSPTDSTCGTGIGNSSVQSPVRTRALNINPPD